MIHLDSFGNLITSLPAELLESGRGSEILIEVEETEGPSGRSSGGHSPTSSRGR